MRSTIRAVALSLLAAGGFAQHSGGFGRGFAAPSGARIGDVAPPSAGAGRYPAFRPSPRIRSAYVPGEFGHRFGYRNGFGYGYFAPYFPFYDFGGSLAAYPEEYPAGGNVFVFPPTTDANPQPPSPSAQPASGVIHEYNVNPQLAAEAGKEAAFTIALKDGSTRSAVAFWVQHGKLHYIDSQDRQHVVSPDLIDRETTERLNREKNLIIQLPPI